MVWDSSWVDWRERGSWNSQGQLSNLSSDTEEYTSAKNDLHWERAKTDVTEDGLLSHTSELHTTSDLQVEEWELWPSRERKLSLAEFYPDQREDHIKSDHIRNVHTKSDHIRSHHVRLSLYSMLDFP